MIPGRILAALAKDYQEVGVEHQEAGMEGGEENERL